MNPNYTEFKFPQIKAHPWHKVSSYLLLCARGDYAIRNYLRNTCNWRSDLTTLYIYIRFSTRRCQQKQWI